MDKFVFYILERYFDVLGNTGYYRRKDVEKLLVLVFLYELLYSDYRGYVGKKHYGIINRALECLYGTTCLIPYADYLKMGKLKIGEMAEVISRVSKLDEQVRDFDLRIKNNGVQILDNMKRIDSQGSRLSSVENTKVVKGKTFIKEIPDMELS